MKEIKETKYIKYGIISQESDNININELFKCYFEKANPTIIESNENNSEFTINNNQDLHYTFKIITKESYN